MRQLRNSMGFMVLGMITFASPLHALTISTSATYSTDWSSSTTIPSDSATAHDGSILSWAGTTIVDTDEVMAAATSQGYIAASGTAIDYHDNWASYEAEASLLTTYRNNLNVDLSYVLDFHVPEINLYTASGNGITDPSIADFSLAILLDGVTIWSYIAELQASWGDNMPPSTSLSIGGWNPNALAYDYTEDLMWGNGAMATAHFAPYDARLDLGSIAAYSTFELEYLVTVGGSAVDRCGTAWSYVGDPLSLNSSSSAFSAHAYTAVPEPATMISFAIGLIGIVGVRSRKKKK